MAKRTSGVTHVALLLIILLMFLIIGKGLCKWLENYEHVIDYQANRSCAPEGYSRGMCPDPDTYDWTRGDCVVVHDGPDDLRLRWSKNEKICACIPNDWEPSTIPKMLKAMENPHFL